MPRSPAPGRRTHVGVDCDTEVICVITRFELRSLILLPMFYMLFRQVRNDAMSNVPGLLKAVCMREGWRTCYTFSIWADEASIATFGHLRSHVRAGNWAMGACGSTAGPLRIWSTRWRLHALSHNLTWSGLDQSVLRHHLTWHPEGAPL